ncbi:glycosyltransferase family 4 protein [Paenibacillus puerhi]|uniref:glycosyltransferase family 4 protein n=1 Tax=Paenibacillus puerhi TaxID=2692622 RepID=UPI00135B638C|nr:glycosyltransferase family 4 protein [Paenibacillus puerhi]
MNILQLSKHMNDSGVNSHIIQLSHTLSLEGNYVIVVSSGGPHKRKLEKIGIEHIEIPLMSKNPFIQLMNLIFLIRLVHKNNIDIIHTHWRSTGIYTKLLSLLTGIEFIWTNHSNHIPSNLIYKTFTFCGKKTLTVSSDMLPMLNEKLGIPKNKLKVVYNGIESDSYIKYSEEKKQKLREQFNVKNEKVICLLGRLTEIKGHLYLMDALGEMLKNFNPKFECKVLLTGNGADEYKSKIIQRAELHGLKDNIDFTGYVNPVDMLNISDLMVLPSKNEGFGIVCIEAFAMHVPVIRTKTGGYSDMKDYCIGVDYGDIKALSVSIYDVLTDNSRATDMVNKAYHFYKDNLTSRKMAEEIINIYKS